MLLIRLQPARLYNRSQMPASASSDAMSVTMMYEFWEYVHRHMDGNELIASSGAHGIMYPRMCCSQLAAWSSGMILASGARGPGSIPGAALCFVKKFFGKNRKA